jgi:glycosyltransferase involved in cell wall biosynthesis
MPKLSVVIITYNEEKRIADCLSSVTWADEIIVVDSYSTDKTLEVCRKFGVRVIQHEWPGHVKQKNYALTQAAHDWVLSLDADEVASPLLAAQVQQLMQQGPPEAAGYYFPRQTYYLGRWIKHCGWYPDYKLRLVDRQRAHWEGEDPHDSLVCRGKTAKLSGRIYHYSFDGLADHLDTIDRFTTIAARERHKKGARANLGHLVLRPPFTFLKMYLLKLGLLDGLQGLIICVLSAYHVFVKYAKLWELNHKQDRQNGPT